MNKELLYPSHLTTVISTPSWLTSDILRFSSQRGFIHKTNVLLRGANKNVKMQINFLMKLQ